MKLLRDLSNADLCRYWDKVGVAGSSDCWLWLGGCDYDGYGIFWAQRTSWRANRIALGLSIGAMPENMACHTCDKPPCCNAAHLFEGTAFHNNRDALRKGRYENRPNLRTADSYMRGVESHLAKLTVADVVSIRKYAAHGFTAAEIQQVYSQITWQNIAAIVKRRTWKHIL